MVFNHAILKHSCRHHLLNSAENGLCFWVIIYLQYFRCLSFLLVLLKWPQKDLHDSAELVYNMKILERNKSTKVNRFLALPRGRDTIEGSTIAAASDHDILLSVSTIHLLQHFYIYKMRPSHILRNSLSASLLVNEFRFKGGGMPFLPHQRNYVYCTKCTL